MQLSTPLNWSKAHVAGILVGLAAFLALLGFLQLQRADLAREEFRRNEREMIRIQEQLQRMSDHRLLPSSEEGQRRDLRELADLLTAYPDTFERLTEHAEFPILQALLSGTDGLEFTPEELALEAKGWLAGLSWVIEPPKEGADYRVTIEIQGVKPVK